MIEKHNKTLDRARATLDEVEKALVQASASDAELRRLRDRVEPLPPDLQNVIDRLTPRLQAIEARLQELGSPSPDAKPDASAPAPPSRPRPRNPRPNPRPRNPQPRLGRQNPTPKPPPPRPRAQPRRSRSRRTLAPASSATAVVNAEWTDQRKLYDDIEATLKRARSLQIEARQTLVAIIARQRSLFAKTLFLRSRPLFSPDFVEGRPGPCAARGRGRGGLFRGARRQFREPRERRAQGRVARRRRL